MARDSLQDLAYAGVEVGALIARVGPGQWSDPTPCAEWSVRDVVHHLVGLNLVFAAMLHDQPPPERGADVLGADPVEAYRESNAMLHKAFAQPGVLEREFRGPLGVATGEQRLQIRLADLIVHGWDLARATGLQLRIPEELAERSLQLTRASMATQSRAGRFDEPQPVDEDAPALDRLAAFLGRTVGQGFHRMEHRVPPGVQLR